MNSKNIRKYNTLFRKKLVENLNKISDNQILIDIYNIIVEDIGHNYSVNRNGLFINLNILSDFCIDKLTDIIDLHKQRKNLNNSDNYNYNNYKYDDIELINEIGHKLTNQEKILIKKIKKTV